MIFIFATAVCGYAQETPSTEQNDDSELISRYQNRRTMRGYKMLFEAGYQWGKMHTAVAPCTSSTLSMVGCAL